MPRGLLLPFYLLLLCCLLGRPVARTFADFKSDAKESCDFLFIPHDAGESYMLQPVIDRFASNSSYSFLILTLGQPSTDIYAGNYTQQRTLSSLGIDDIQIEDGTEQARAQLLSDKDIKIILESIQTTFVVTGMVYSMQAQISSSYKNVYDSTIVGLDDSFSLWDPNSILSTEFTSPGIVDEVFFTADDIAFGMSNEASPTPIVATVTGSPTLDSWEVVASDVANIRHVRNVIYSKDGEEDDFIGIVFAGGYTDSIASPYDASLRVLCTTAINVVSSSSNYRFLFSPHPGYDPRTYEVPRFKKWGCGEDIIRVLSEDEGFSTAEVVAASNVSLSECSTVGGQSLAISKPHSFISRSYACVDIFTEAGLIPYSLTPEILEETITETFHVENYYVPRSDIVAAGIPLLSTERIWNRMNAILSNKYTIVPSAVFDV